jgi:hypothetical protein
MTAGGGEVTGLHEMAFAGRMTAMTTVALSAHFDGEKIRLDELYKLPDNARNGHNCQLNA